MVNRLITIQILCEGLEEKAYIDKILSMPTIRKDVYSFFPTINCKSITKIFPRFQDVFSQNYANIILIFCDADNNSSNFRNLVSKIDNCIFGRTNISKKIIIFANPVTLQIILSHFSYVSLKVSSKSSNQKIIETLTDIKNYQAHNEQIRQLVSLINFSNYEVMKENLKTISKKVTDVPSTNFLDFAKSIENEDTTWCNEIIDLIEKGE